MEELEMPRVLIVEDDPAMATALRDGFAYEKFEVDQVADGEAALAALRMSPPDLLILDVMLPKLSGLDVCKQIRSEGSRLPIIMVTARGQEIDKVLGLKIGADDYVTKPFSFLELMARVEALLRRTGVETGRDGLDSYSFGNVAVDFRSAEARRGGELMELSPRELKLLEFFIRRRGEVLSRSEILDVVWDYDSAPLTRTVDMHVAKLRSKIESTPANPKWIVTVHRMGYKFMG
jgi:DNA-binding response OmpR family regulator